MAVRDFRRVYVWQFPVRVFHWVNALAISVLIFTGFVIANPPAWSSTLEATNSFWFRYIRLIHFIAAYTIIAAFIVRIYWAFAGNQFASWKIFFPYTKKGLKNLLYVFKVDILLLPDKEHKLSNISIGHNSVAGLSYFILFLLLIVQMMTGFALFQDNATWWFPKLFAWVSPLFGGDSVVRYIHHVVNWLVIVFTIVHVYLVLFHDYVEARGETSSMISGFKFVVKQRINTEDATVETGEISDND